MKETGIGIGGLVFVVLLVLKLTVRQDMSWFWVTLPLWGVAGIVLGVVACIGIVWCLLRLLEWATMPNPRKPNRHDRPPRSNHG